MLVELCKVCAPFIPFLSDAIYLQLKRKEDPESVHLCRFPQYQAALRDEALELEMADVQSVVSIGHALRKENKLKVRQPLGAAFVICADTERLKALAGNQNLIADELNVKEVILESDETAFVTLQAKPNFRVLGKKVGKLMNACQSAIQKLEYRLMKKLFENHSVTITVEGEAIELTPEDVSVERQVKEGLIATTDKGITVVLNTELTEPLLLEGIAREIVNKINTMRREMDFAVTDRINVKIETSERVKTAFELHHEYICHEVLAVSFSFEPCSGEAWDINGEMSKIALAKALI